MGIANAKAKEKDDGVSRPAEQLSYFHGMESQTISPSGTGNFWEVELGRRTKRVRTRAFIDVIASSDKSLHQTTWILEMDISNENSRKLLHGTSLVN